MQPGTDPLAPSSLANRRPAAPHLPNFELPPPPTVSLAGKYQPFAAINATNPTPSSGSIASVGNLLTPPNTLPNESLSPISSGMNSNGSSNTQGGFPGYWPQQSHNAPQYPYPTGTTPQWIPPRGLFSPVSASLNSMVRNQGSPNSADGISQPPYEMTALPPFQTSLSMSAPATLPAMTHPHSQMLNGSMINGQSGSTPTSQASPVSGHDAFQGRPGPNQNYYGTSPPSSATPQQAPFTFSSGASPTAASPVNNGQPQRMSPQSNGNNDMQSLPHNNSHGANGYPRPYGQYSLPAMGGPVMSNLHSPSGHMSLVGGMGNGMIPGFNSGHAASIQQMYGVPHHSSHHQQQQQQAPNDRPFKCDQCVQSFNRNHDLKRHKRIHLAVKPYPCGHCDKSFSRKDALKRHILVKGCGKTGSSENDRDRSLSPTTRPNEDGRRSADSSDS